MAAPCRSKVRRVPGVFLASNCPLVDVTSSVLLGSIFLGRLIHYSGVGKSSWIGMDTVFESFEHGARLCVFRREMMTRVTRVVSVCVALLALIACGGKKSSGGGSSSGGPGGECTDQVTSDQLPLYIGDFFDAHGHWLPTWSDQVVPKVVSDGGLVGFVVLGLDNTLALQQQDADTYVNCAWFEVKNGISSPDETLAEIRETLDAGARCIGETSVRHFAAGPQAEPKEYSATESFLLSVYEEARVRGVPVNVHYDHSDSNRSDWEAGLKAARDERRSDTSNDAIIVWAHSGDAPATVVGELLAAHRNLYIDLSSRNPLCSYQGRLVSMDEQRLDDGTLVLKSDWKQVMENYSERILVGTDVGPGQRHLEVKKTVAYYRTILGQLSQTAADNIAHKNARKLFGMSSP
ncbi:MAG TPA: hypothetical protein EYN06_04720 [Myxococcales bacterium]|nr:hypothetical protein [Myxococcales bacterium]